MGPPQVNGLTCKIIIVGNSNVGKTALMHRFCRNLFDKNGVTTVGANFEVKTLKIGDKEVKIQIWDTAGQERYFTLTKMYYRYVTGIVFVYDVTQQETMFNIQKWFDDAEKEAPPDVIKVLVGHKCEDESSKMISTDEGKAVADYFGLPFFEASSKENLGVEPIFNFIASKAIELHRNEPVESKNSSVLTIDNNRPKSGSSCC